MNKKFTLIGIVLLLPMFLLAQKGKDFILTMNQDTLYGKIKFNQKSDIISFQYKGEKVEFHASTINYFGVHRKGTTRIYKTLINNWKEYIFVEVLSEGRLNLYYYDTAGNHRYTSADPYRYYIGNNDIYPIRMSPRAYKNLMKMMVKDSPDLLAQMGTYEDVPRIIKKYNKF